MSLEVDNVHRVACRVEVRHAHDNDDQRQGQDGSLDACRVLNHSENGAENGRSDSEHEEEVTPHQVHADRCVRAAGSDRVDHEDYGDSHQNTQQYV